MQRLSGSEFEFGSDGKFSRNPIRSVEWFDFLLFGEE